MRGRAERKEVRVACHVFNFLRLRGALRPAAPVAFPPAPKVIREQVVRRSVLFGDKVG